MYSMSSLNKLVDEMNNTGFLVKEVQTTRNELTINFDLELNPIFVQHYCLLAEVLQGVFVTQGPYIKGYVIRFSEHASASKRMLQDARHFQALHNAEVALWK